jgi:crotonobetainyl-CoA:carnitine CoA-transferase CaiB-like acyl-CoA transferase
LDLTWLLPGEYATMTLADLGADVIKVEPPPAGVYGRTLWPEVYALANFGKRSVILDLKQQAGAEVLRSLAAQCDVLIEGFRPGVMDRLGLSAASLRAVNSDLIHCSISGYGQTGPRRDEPGHDINYLALAGGLAVSGDLRYPAIRPGVPLVDMGTAMTAVASICAALARKDGPKGVDIDIAMADVAVAFASPRWGKFLAQGEVATNEEMPHLAPGNRVYTTADGLLIALGALEEKFWQSLVQCLGLGERFADPELATSAGRIRRHAEVGAVLEETFAQRPRAQWLDLLSAADVPASPVNDIPAVFTEAQFADRDLFENYGAHGHRVRSPISLDGARLASTPEPEPAGASTRAVLADLAGLDAASIDRLVADGIVATPSPLATRQG